MNARCRVKAVSAVCGASPRLGGKHEEARGNHEKYEQRAYRWPRDCATRMLRIEHPTHCYHSLAFALFFADTSEFRNHRPNGLVGIANLALLATIFGDEKAPTPLQSLVTVARI